MCPPSSTAPRCNGAHDAGAGSRPRTCVRGSPATEAPAVVSAARRTSANNMPAIYQDGDFGLRFLGALETLLDPIVATLDVPRQLLPLDARPARRARAARRVGRASRRGELARRAAARGALARERDLAPPRHRGRASRWRSRSRSRNIPLRVEDGGGVTWSTDPNAKTKAPPPSFVVYCDTPIPEKTQLAIARVIEETKPVHVDLQLRVKAAKRPTEAAADEPPPREAEWPSARSARPRTRTSTSARTAGRTCAGTRPGSSRRSRLRRPPSLRRRAARRPLQRQPRPP